MGDLELWSQDLVDQRMSETLPKLEALRAADSEQSQQLQQLNKAVNDLAESTRGLQKPWRHAF